MKDLKVGDRILMIDNIIDKETYMSVGTVKQVFSNSLIRNYIFYTIDFDKKVDLGWDDEDLGIEDGHGRHICDIDKYIKIEEGKYANEDFRLGDEVIVYNKRNMNKAVKVRIQNFYKDRLLGRDKNDHVYIVNKEDVLFLLKREEYRIGDIVIINDGFQKNIKAKIIESKYANTFFKRVKLLENTY